MDMSNEAISKGIILAVYPLGWCLGTQHINYRTAVNDDVMLIYI